MIEVSFPRYKIIVCVAYRSPSAINPFWNNLHYSVEKAIESSSRVVITGDLNVDLLIETNHRLNEIMYNFNLRNCINEPTGFGALLDPIIYSDECEISFSDVIQIDRNISDHDATSVSLRIPYNLQAKYQREVWLNKHADFINLNSEIRLFDWEGFLLSSENIDDMSIKFTNKFFEFVKIYIPVKSIAIRPNDKPWFNSSIRRAMRIRDRFHKQVKQNTSPFLLRKYKTQRTKVNNMINYAREQFFINANDMLDKNG